LIPPRPSGSLTSPQIQLSDFDDFDYIFAMDRQNLRDIKHLQKRRPHGKAEVMLFGEYSGGETEEVDDPYYGARDGFEIAYEQCVRFSTNFLEEIGQKKERGGLGSL
jgi:low molecular weight phosphotyrosine protein phosphatase